MSEWESLSGKGRSTGEGKVQQGETERVDEAPRRKNDARPTEQTHKNDLHRECKQEETLHGRGTDIEEQISFLPVDMKVNG